MDEQNNLITYEQDWQSVSEPEYPVVSAEQPEQEEPEADVKPRSKRPPQHLLLTVQLAACVLLAAAAFAVKSIGGEVYDVTHSWYERHLNDTAIFDGRRDTVQMPFDVATKDEA